MKFLQIEHKIQISASHKTHCMSVTTSIVLMLFRIILAASCENLSKYANIIWDNSQRFNIELGGICCNKCVVQGSVTDF